MYGYPGWSLPGLGWPPGTPGATGSDALPGPPGAVAVPATGAAPRAVLVDARLMAELMAQLAELNRTLGAIQAELQAWRQSTLVGGGAAPGAGGIPIVGPTPGAGHPPPAGPGAPMSGAGHPLLPGFATHPASQPAQRAEPQREPIIWHSRDGRSGSITFTTRG